MSMSMSALGCAHLEKMDCIFSSYFFISELGALSEYAEMFAELK